MFLNEYAISELHDTNTTSALERHQSRLCRVSGYSIVQIARPIPDIEFNDLHSQ
jgi:hypothetical protein